MIRAAEQVGPAGIVWGLDMTDEMLALARQNAADAGVDQRPLPQGHIEEVPLPAESVDVAISNCVINLSTDKPAVFRELARVLAPGGRVAISDIVAEDRLTPDERAERGSYCGCIAGALSKERIRAGLVGRRLRGRLGRVHVRGRRGHARRDRQGEEAGAVARLAPATNW